MATKNKEVKEETSMMSGEVIQLRTYEAQITNLAGYTLLMDKMPESVSQEKGEKDVRKGDKVKLQKENYLEKLYCDNETNLVYLDSIAIQASMFRGAKWWEDKVFGNTKTATLIAASCAVSGKYNYLKWTPKDDEYISADDPGIRPYDSIVRRKTGESIFVRRPEFNTWSLTFHFDCFDPRIDVGSLEIVLKYAGYYVGLGAWRPNHGRFVLTSLKEMPISKVAERLEG